MWSGETGIPPTLVGNTARVSPPRRDFRDGERVFDSHNAEAQAEELAHLLTQQAEPRLRQLGGDPEGLRTVGPMFVVELSTRQGSAGSPCLAARTQGPQAALGVCR